MGFENMFWNRDSLYEEVWATPMWKLAQKYGISDVGLAKVCRRPSIPVPGRGYWAKKDAGQAVEKLPLPPLKDYPDTKADAAAGTAENRNVRNAG